MPRWSVEVRRAGPDDLAVVTALLRASGEDADAAAGPAPGAAVLSEVAAPVPAGAASVAERVAAVLAGDCVEVHLALAQGEPVGLAAVRTGDLLPLVLPSAVHVEHLYVLPAWRRRGVARQLLAVAVAAAERAGADEVTCAVSAGREAHRFLARLGFARLVVVRTAPVSRLRRGLAGDDEGGRRRASLDSLVARRRRQLDRPETPSAGLPAQAPGGADEPGRSSRLSAWAGRSAGRPAGR